MNMTVLLLASALAAAGAMYAKGWLDSTQRAAVQRIVDEKKELERQAAHLEKLRQAAAREAHLARVTQQEKEREADELRKELEKRVIPACAWTPADRRRLLNIRIGDTAGAGN